jgi:peroxiredoxin
MRLIATCLLSLFCWVSTQAQSDSTILINGQLSPCAKDTLYFFVLDGISLIPQGPIPLTPQGEGRAFTAQLPRLPQGFYLVGDGTAAGTKSLILGDEPVVTIQGSCATLNQAAAVSPANRLLAVAMQKVEQHNQRFQGLIGQLGRAQRTGQGIEAIHQQMGQLDQEKIALLDTLKLENPFVAKTVALRTYLSYPNHGTGYPSEADYFANQYFQFVDWADNAYDRIPLVHEAVKQYATTLAQVGMPHGQQVAYGEALLSRMPEGSPRYRSSLLGLVAGFQAKNPDEFAHFAKKYLQAYADRNPPITQDLRNRLESIQAQLIGAEAPEISLPTPAGDTLSLSDLRGKVVLIDFWASWCGPCRRENPRVKALYERYKDQGFDILGVSLDRDQARWEQAIAQDGLTWHHVSDLKYWQSVAARTYGVGSIPHTVLVDREGNIAAKKLRGAALEKKVAEMLGE